jgi:AGZA family xanthine/uracil permease-like MFS transporter
MLPHVSALLVIKWGSFKNAAGEILGSQLPDLTSPELVGAMLKQGAHVSGHAALAGGSILVGLAWGSATAFLVDRSWYRASIVLAGCAIFSAFGVIHAPSLGIYLGQLPWTYLGLSAGICVIGLLRRYFKPIGS